jgi:c-di-GMP-related signal transduction protein
LDVQSFHQKENNKIHSQKKCLKFVVKNELRKFIHILHLLS